MTVKETLDWCQEHVGIGESGGTNHTVFWDWFQDIYGVNYQGSYWCGAAVDVALNHGGWKAPEEFISVAYIEAWGKYRGRFHYGLQGCKPGDVLILIGYGVHTGICREEPSGEFVKTYEGNTSPMEYGSQDNGDGFYAKTRHASLVRGYVKIHDILNDHSDFKLRPLPLKVDGNLGEQTVGHLQKQMNMDVVNGHFGEQTRRKLERHLNNKLELPRDRELKVDGRLTRRSIRKLQKYVGIPAVYRNGKLNDRTVKHLQRMLNEKRF